jgi:hypothetical protein
MKSGACNPILLIQMVSWKAPRPIPYYFHWIRFRHIGRERGAESMMILTVVKRGPWEGDGIPTRRNPNADKRGFVALPTFKSSVYRNSLLDLSSSSVSLRTVVTISSR